MGTTALHIADFAAAGDSYWSQEILVIMNCL